MGQDGVVCKHLLQFLECILLWFLPFPFCVLLRQVVQRLRDGGQVGQELVVELHKPRNERSCETLEGAGILVTASALGPLEMPSRDMV